MELDATSLAEVRGLLGQEINWDLLITQSLKHGTTGLLYKNLVKFGEYVLPWQRSGRAQGDKLEGRLIELPKGLEQVFGVNARAGFD